MDKFCIDGPLAAPATPMCPNGDINPAAVGDYAKFLSTHDIDGVFILGTLGEGMSLTVEERKQVAAAWVKESKDRLKYVVVHVGTGNLRDSIELAKHAESIKASAIACISPSFYKPSDEETMVEYMAEVAAAAPNTPFYYYCYDGMTGVKLNTARVLELASKSIPTLRGVKMSSSHLPNLLDCTKICDGRLNIMVGTDEQLLTALTLKVRVPILSGHQGAVFKRMREAFDRGDMEAAYQEQWLARKLMHIKGKHGQGGAPVVKAVMKCYGLDLGPVRLPFKSLSDSSVEEIRKDLKELGMLD